MDVLVDLRGVVSVEAFADVTHGVPQDVSANDRLVFSLPSAIRIRASTYRPWVKARDHGDIRINFIAIGLPYYTYEAKKS